MASPSVASPASEASALPGTGSASGSAATILAVGAAGDFAGLVVPELARRGARVRGLVRDAREADIARGNGALEVAVGDLRDRKSLDAALEGIHSVFYIAPAFIPDEAEIGKDMVDAAKCAGVRRFVFSSVIDPILSRLVNHGAKAPVEEAILASDMEYTFLHPTLFFQNFARSWPSIVKTGIYSEPWSAKRRFTRVDYRDVAEIAAIALTEDRLLYGTFELCAEGNLDRDDVVAMMSEVLGRKVAAGTLHATYDTAHSKNAGEAKHAEMQAMFDWYDAHGFLGNPLVLRAILGREPRTLRAYFEELFAASQADVPADTSSTASEPASTIPPDDPGRDLTLAGPAEDATLKHVALAGDIYTMLLTGEDTAGKFCLIDMQIPPGGGPPPHRHDFEETFSVLAGECVVTFREKKVTVRAGESANVPANAPHFIHNDSTEMAHVMCTCAPAGQDAFFLAVGTPVPSRTSPVPTLTDAEVVAQQAKAKELAPRYVTEFV